ncbi:hypothetical protein QA612_07950 [Evansella sp. AB-P1]|uniref:hypothetical protein n=1 Tax=Evansella sp. AB-P1 TaxID=3037653 RepID=UPI00241C947C|nr:hypothetical protein [Evansella sp. AB-P1]MDG5787425.1 hypothetical protein [Evansella sp. AB-P1]
MNKIIFLLLSLLLITACGSNVIQQNEEGTILTGKVVDTFNYEYESMTIEGKYRDIGVSGGKVNVGIRLAKLINKDEETIEFQDISEGDRVEVLLINTDMDDTDPPTLSNSARRVKIMD